MLTRLPLILSWQRHAGEAEAIYAHYLRHAMHTMDAWLAHRRSEDLAVAVAERPLKREGVISGS
jgi:hypothetical protein